ADMPPSGGNSGAPTDDALVGPQPPDEFIRSVVTLSSRPTANDTSPATDDIDATGLAFAALAMESDNGKPPTLSYSF
ncbi:MAG: hypothetical protein O2946_13745, partial [Planctomycetota bacterium]|nr:hypothetical protein [Planctomycetota bacterium]